MADNRQEIEIDTDGVNEEVINVETPEETGSAFERKEDVDLGYTDVSGNKTAKELLQEAKSAEKTKLENVTEEKEEAFSEEKGDLEDYSEKVKKRINRLTFQIREAERRERAAVEYAKGLKNKYEVIEKKFDETDSNYLKEYGSRVEAEREKVKNALKAALEANDVDKIAEAQDGLSRLSVEKEKVALAQAEKEVRAKQLEEEKANTISTQPTPQISRKAQEWAEDNEWFGSDRVMTSAAMGIHEDIMQQGIDAESDEYYNQINKRMKEYFPQKFAQKATEEVRTTKEPVQNVGSVSRRAGGRKSVKLTKSQVVIAKKFATAGFEDPGNVSKKLREGWEFVKAETILSEIGENDYPVIHEGRHAGLIGIGGLVLARIPEEILKSRAEYFRKITQDRTDAIDRELMKEQHPDMPINIDRQSRVTFGGSRKK
jgi:hypothetical protein